MVRYLSLALAAAILISAAVIAACTSGSELYMAF